MKNKVFKIVLSLLLLISLSWLSFGLTINVNAENKIVNINTDFGYDVTNTSNILGLWEGSVGGAYFSASSNQTLNGTRYSSVKCLKMSNNNYITYNISDDIGVKSISIDLYGKGNSSSGSASYQLSIYNESGTLLSSSPSVSLVVASFTNSVYSTITSDILNNNKITLSANSLTDDIATIKLTLTSVSNTVLTRVNLSYSANSSAFDTFSTLQTKASMKLKYNSGMNVDIMKFVGTETSSITLSNTANELNLSETTYSVTAVKNDSSLTPALNSNNHDIRIYGNATKNGGCITISRLDEVKIKKITITFMTNYNNGCEVKANNVIIAPVNNVYDFGDGVSSFTIQNVNNSTTQVRISQVDIETNTGIEFVGANTAIRFGTTITKELYDQLISNAGIEFGVIAAITENLHNQSLTYDNAAIKKAITPVRVAEIGGVEASETGEYYQFALVIANIPVTDYSTSITSSCYIKCDGNYYYMQPSVYSLASLANKYLENYNNNVSGYEVCGNHLSALNFLNNQIDESDEVFIYFVDLEGNPGDCSLIKVGDIDILVDAGESDSVSTTNVRDFLEDKVTDGIIEYVVATHPDSDHIAGLPSVFSSFQINTLFKYATNKSNTITSNFDLVIQNEECSVNIITTWLNNQDSRILEINENVSLEFYNTGSYLTGTDSNASSIVFMLTAYGTKVLFSGDSGSEQEAIYTPLCGDVDIYSLGHHGSYNSTSTAGLGNMKPEVCIAQVGDHIDNEYHHPHYDTLDRVYAYNTNTMVYCTAGEYDSSTGDYSYNRNGTITITISQLSYELSSEFYNELLIEMRDTVYWSNK